MIRKCIHWATAVALWPQLWATKPTQFWYFYPNYTVATVEFDEKWVKEWLPRGEMKQHPIFGWTEEKKNKEIRALRFNSGITVYFKSYDQKAEDLQTASVYSLFCDEELPEHLYSELNSRISAPTVKGYFHMVFTATLGQEIWRATMEERGTRYEKFPTAAKWQVSMYDCLTYMDGSNSLFTPDYIDEIKRSCKNEAEIQRRVYGRFVLAEDLKYGSFSKPLNFVPAHKLPKGWHIYVGVDIGSGGTAHPAAIAFVAVKPDFTAGRVFLGWRGDGVTTTAGDVLDKYLELRGSRKVTAAYYDHQAKDFFTIASRRGVPFLKADKARDAGEGLLNVLFKNGMLKIYDGECKELAKLVTELMSLKNSTPKPQAVDDFIDALRFAVTQIPWDFEAIRRKKPKAKGPIETMSLREQMRRGIKEDNGLDGIDLIEAEIDLANDVMEYGFDQDGQDIYGD